jgi:hypothetical protein
VALRTASTGSIPSTSPNARSLRAVGDNEEFERLFVRFTLRAVDDGLELMPDLRPDALEQLLADAPRREALRLITAHNGLLIE